jgi:hypothetical protein
MSTSAVSSTSLNNLQQYFQTRQSDLQQLGKALGSGDLAAAKTAYGKIVALGENGPFRGGDPFKINQREQDFTAIGQALQSGDLAGAKQAFGALKESFEPRQVVPPTATSASTSTPSTSSSLSGLSVKA